MIFCKYPKTGKSYFQKGRFLINSLSLGYSLKGRQPLLIILNDSRSQVTYHLKRLLIFLRTMLFVSCYNFWINSFQEHTLLQSFCLRITSILLNVRNLYRRPPCSNKVFALCYVYIYVRIYTYTYIRIIYLSYLYT